ncbi:MAG: guanylate kinase [Bacteroidota bacterium]
MKGKLIVVSGPSGSGKTTIARRMMVLFPSLEFSISATTRPKRPSEVDGRDYYFLTKAAFRQRVESGEFVEWEELFGNFYGTLQTEIDRKLEGGKHLLFDVDVKGALSIKRRYPESFLVFVRPPSIEVLHQRLCDRHTEDEDALRLRFDRAAMELDMRNSFDCQVLNENLEQAVASVSEFVKNHIHISGEELNPCR